MYGNRKKILEKVAYDFKNKNCMFMEYMSLKEILLDTLNLLCLIKRIVL